MHASVIVMHDAAKSLQQAGPTDLSYANARNLRIVHHASHITNQFKIGFEFLDRYTMRGARIVYHESRVTTPAIVGLTGTEGRGA